MAVEFEFEVITGFHFSDVFAERFNMPVVNNRVCLPEMLGDGFIQEVYLNNGLALCIHKYVLKQEFIIKRIEGGSSEPLTMKFDCRRIQAETDGSTNETLFNSGKGCDVELGTANFFTELILPPHKIILFIVIGTTRSALMNLLKLEAEESDMEHMIKSNKSFVLHERMTHEMERALKQLGQITESTKLAQLQYEIKSQELIYFFFKKLLQRNAGEAVTVNQEDVATIYKIRTVILEDLGVIPELPKLAKLAGMSQSKLKLLFNQIFGKSIYNYYQAERMDEAALLLNSFSVSETGYKVGFTNLSHFARLFEKHHSIKPKKYKDSVKVSNKSLADFRGM